MIDPNLVLARITDNIRTRRERLAALEAERLTITTELAVYEALVEEPVAAPEASVPPPPPPPIPLPRRSVVPEPLVRPAPVERTNYSIEKLNKAVALVAEFPGHTANELGDLMKKRRIVSGPHGSVMMSVLATRGMVERRRFTGEARQVWRYWPNGQAPKSTIGLGSFICSGNPPVVKAAS